LQQIEELKEYLPDLKVKEVEDYKSWDDKDDLTKAKQRYETDLINGVITLKDYTEGIVHIPVFMSKFPFLSFEVSQVIKHAETDTTALINRVDAIAANLVNKMDLFEKNQVKFDQLFNQKCNVH